MRKVLMGLVLAASVLAAQESVKEQVKQDFKTAGRAVGHAAVATGHAVRNGAKAVKSGVKGAAHSGKAKPAGQK